MISTIITGNPDLQPMEEVKDLVEEGLFKKGKRRHSSSRANSSWTASLLILAGFWTWIGFWMALSAPRLISNISLHLSYWPCIVRLVGLFFCEVGFWFGQRTYSTAGRSSHWRRKNWVEKQKESMPGAEIERGIYVWDPLKRRLHFLY